MDFFFFLTLVTGPSRSLSLKLSDTRVYEPQIPGVGVRPLEASAVGFRAAGEFTLLSAGGFRLQALG